MAAENLDLTERVMITPSGKTFVLVETPKGLIYHVDEFYDKNSKFRDAAELDKIISKALLKLPFELQFEIEITARYTESLASQRGYDFHRSLVLTTASKIEHLRREYGDEFRKVFPDYENVFDYLLGIVGERSFNPLFRNLIKSLDSEFSHRTMYEGRGHYKMDKGKKAEAETKDKLYIVK